MRRTNYLIVRGEAPEIDKLVARIEADDRDGGWKREPEVGPGSTPNGIGRPEHFIYHWSGGEGRPAATLSISKVGPGQLSIFTMLPNQSRPLALEEFNRILADFAETVLGSMIEGLRVEMIVISPPKERLAFSLSPEAYRRLLRFRSRADDFANLTIEDWARWDDFWTQVYSDRSMVEDKDLGDWLLEEGLSEDQVSRLIHRSDTGRFLTHNNFKS